MTLPSSGSPISMSQVNTELGVAADTQRSLGDSSVRTMFGKSSGAIILGDGFGRSNSTSISLTIDTSPVYNYNIHNAAVAAGWDGASPVSVTLTVVLGRSIGSTSTAVAALTTGTFPAGSQITINLNGSLLGAGGAGGAGANGGNNNYNGNPGQPGGAALELNFPVTIINEGLIYGGGGGGGGGASYFLLDDSSGYVYKIPGGGGGGGGGYNGGAGGAAGKGGTVTAAAGKPGTSSRSSQGGTGGAGGSTEAGSGGTGGNWALPGAKGGDSQSGYYTYSVGGVGGAAGPAIKTNGNSIVWGGSRGSSATYVKGAIV